MSLAQRVRDYRYSKGWGPDELASKAEISRTALYQIESGKTGLPRAGTLRRIAVALDVTMDELLGNPEPAATATTTTRAGAERSHASVGGRDLGDWMPSEGGPLNLSGSHSHSPAHGHHTSHDDARVDEHRYAEPPRRFPSVSFEGLLMREGELMSKLHDLLHSPLGAGIARIIDELHQIVPRGRNLS